MNPGQEVRRTKVGTKPEPEMAGSRAPVGLVRRYEKSRCRCCCFGSSMAAERKFRKGLSDEVSTVRAVKEGVIGLKYCVGLTFSALNVVGCHL